MRNRFGMAMAAYAALAILAGVTITGSIDSVDGKLRVGVWILLAALAFKTYIAHKTGRDS